MQVFSAFSGLLVDYYNSTCLRMNETPATKSEQQFQDCSSVLTLFCHLVDFSSLSFASNR